MTPGSEEWLASTVEDVIDPDVAIIDPHHHLWPPGGPLPYGLQELEADLASGHNIIDTVFIECNSSYRPDGPDHLRSVGETEFVASAAESSTRQVMGGIVAHVDLTDADHLDAALAAHSHAADGRFRGIRHAGSHALHPEVLMIPGRAPAGLYLDEGFQAGVRQLGERGLTYDTWHYHYQNQEFVELARAAPDTLIVLDHFGTPLGVGPYADQREEIFEQWLHGHHRHRRLPERGGQARRAGDARQRVRVEHGRASADVAAVRRRAGAVLRAHDRVPSGRTDACSNRTSPSTGSRCRTAPCGTG